MNILLIRTGMPDKEMKGIGGAGLAVIKIAETLAKNDKVYVLTGWSKNRLFVNNRIINKVEYISRGFGLNKLMAVLKIIISGDYKHTIKYSKGLTKIKYVLYYIFDRIHIESILDKYQIDVINLHGQRLTYLPFLDVAVEKKIPIVCTSHGLNSLDPNVEIDFNKQYESYFFKRISDIKNATITTVSTSIKEKCVNNFEISPDRIKVILNGVDHNKFRVSDKTKIELRNRHSLSKESIIFLQVGKLGREKNHISILRSIKNMNEKMKKRLIYLIVGEGKEKKNILKFIGDNNLQNQVVLTGFLFGDSLIDMYHLSDYFILPSTSEGLPLVFLEAMAAGLPIITFKDLEGVKDLYNSETMVLISKREEEDIINTMEQANNREWDYKKIKEISKSYSWEKVCKEYNKLYRALTKMKLE